LGILGRRSGHILCLLYGFGDRARSQEILIVLWKAPMPEAGFQYQVELGNVRDSNLGGSQ